MKRLPEYSYENGHAICKVTTPEGQVFKGEAFLHEDDKDFESPLTGQQIAEMRAIIDMYKEETIILKAQLKALNQLYYSMKHSKKFEPKSYENIMLQRQIRLITEDLESTKQQLSVAKLDLHEYLLVKDKIRNKVRKNRAALLDK